MNEDMHKRLEENERDFAAHGEAQPPPPADRRAETSPANGQNGGRKPDADWGALALKFSVDTGHFVHWRKPGPYTYDPQTGAYRLYTEKELQAVAGDWLRRYGAGAELSYTVSRVRNLCGALMTEGDLSREPPVWLSTGESAAGWVAMRNGLLDVEAAARGENVKLREHTPDFFSTYAFPYAWEPDAVCPLFENYLQTALPDAENRAMVQMLAGLLLVPDLSYQVAFFLYGGAGCGKTTLLNVLRGMMGPGNVCRVPLADFAEKFTVGALTRFLANLVDEAFVGDGTRGMRWLEDQFKTVTGGDGATIKDERKGENGETSRRIVARSVFCMNPPLPHFIDTSDGLWRRLRLIPFERRFDGTSEHNPNLVKQILAEELPGVFAWAVRGLGMLRTGRNGEPFKVFPQSKAGAEILGTHRASCDREKTFLLDRYEIRREPDYLGGKPAFTRTEDIYKEYAEFCREGGGQPKSRENFAQEIKRVFPEAEQTKNPIHWPGHSVRARGFWYLAKRQDAVEAVKETEI